MYPFNGLSPTLACEVAHGPNQLATYVNRSNVFDFVEGQNLTLPTDLRCRCWLALLYNNAIHNSIYTVRLHRLYKIVHGADTTWG